MKKQNLYSINEVSEKTGVKSQTLRNWEKSGTIKASETIGKHKLFTEQNIAEIEKIKELKNYGSRLNNEKRNGQVVKQNNVEKEKGKVIGANVNKMSKKINIDYSSKSIGELNDLARQNGIKYFRQMNKGELVEALTYPKKANEIIANVKNRTKERYGGKKYGNANQELTIGGAGVKISTVRNIVTLSKQGLTPKEIFEKLN